jgi:anti-sigma factor ChrR (cupin superfamily)
LSEDNVISKKLIESLLDASEPIDPGPDRASSMLKQLKARLHDQTTEPEAVPDFLTVARSSGDWSETSPGNQVKVLRADAKTQSFFVRLAAGTRFPAHSHPGDEETLVLEGKVSFGDIQLEAGDYHLARKGSYHEEVFSEGGCLLYIRAATGEG